MTPIEYRKLAERTEAKFDGGKVLTSDESDALNCTAMRLQAVEKGADSIKRTLIYGAPLNEGLILIKGRGEASLTKKQMELLHHALGSVTESLELFEAVMKSIALPQGDSDFSAPNATAERADPIDTMHLVEELGDQMWYVANMARILDVSLEEIMDVNIRKLQTRFPDKFNASDAIDRCVEAEYEAMGEESEAQE